GMAATVVTSAPTAPSPSDVPVAVRIVSTSTVDDAPTASQYPIEASGTPSDSTASAANPANAGTPSTPNRIRSIGRGEPEPRREYRARPRIRNSASSSTRQHRTSTPASMLAAAPLNVDWNWS